MATIYPAQPNSPATSLMSALAADAVTLPVVDTEKLPEPPNLAVIGTQEDCETILYTGKVGNTLTGVTRGFEGTAKAWPAQTPIARNFTAYDYNTVAGIAQEAEQTLDTLAPVATTGSYSDLVDAPSRLTGTASGTSPLSVTDAEAGKPISLTVLGKTSISGTPSPDSPATIRGAGVGNDCYIKITGGGTSKTYYMSDDFYIHGLTGGTPDRITCKDGVWGIERHVATITYNGTETWTRTTDGATDQKNYFFTSGITWDTSADPICNRFVYTPITTSTAATGFAMPSSGPRIRPGDMSQFPDVASFKAWLAQNPVTIYYQLKEPTWTPLNSSAQTALNSMALYAGDNTVEFGTAPGKPNAGIEVKYYRDINLAFARLEAALTAQ